MTGRRAPIAAAALLLALLLWPASPAAARLRPWAVGSESMAPTMAEGDLLMAWMGRPDPLRRGDIVLVEVPGGGIYIERIAGLPGDRIELVDGIIFLNGQAVEQRFIRVDRFDTRYERSQSAERLVEQFPGEAQPHEIYDTGPSAGDDFPPLLVPPGHLFLLGDNRDRSADSRFSSDDRNRGVGLAPIEKIRGTILFFHLRGPFWQPPGR